MRRVQLIDQLNRRAAAVVDFLFSLALGLALAALLIAFVDRAIGSA